MFNDDHWELRDYPVLFESSRAAEQGITRHKMLRTSRYPIVLRGVRMDRESFVRFRTPRWADDHWMWDALRLRAALIKYPGLVAGHALAARLYGWPLPSNHMTSQVHLCTDDRNARICRPMITLHRTTHFSAVQWFDLPLLSAVDTFIGFGSGLCLRDLVKLGDAAVGNWHGSPQTDRETLRHEIITRKELRGKSRLLAALDLMRPTVDSPRETDLRLWAIEIGLPEPVVHPQIYCSLLGRFVEPDLGFPDEKVAMEYEGDHHRRSKAQWERDIERYDALRHEGWNVVRVTSGTNYRSLEAKLRHHLGLE